ANRFLFALIKRSKNLPFGGSLTDSEILNLGEPCKAPRGRVRSVGRIEMTTPAMKLWVRIYDSLSEAHPGLLGAITARAEAQTIRLALIYALLDGEDKID